MKKVEYVIPLEVARLMDKCIALDKLKDIYVKLPFGYRSAKKLSILSEECRADFWQKVRELYPRLAGKSLVLNRVALTVTESETEKG